MSDRGEQGTTGEPDDCLLFRLLRLAETIGRPLKETLAEPHGLSVTELRILIFLGYEIVTPGHEIARSLRLTPMTVSRALGSLVSRGHVER